MEQTQAIDPVPFARSRCQYHAFLALRDRQAADLVLSTLRCGFATIGSDLDAPRIAWPWLHRRRFGVADRGEMLDRRGCDRAYRRPRLGLRPRRRCLDGSGW